MFNKKKIEKILPSNKANAHLLDMSIIYINFVISFCKELNISEENE